MVVEVDASGNLGAIDGKVRPLKAAGSRSPDDVLLGTFGGVAWFVRSVDAVHGEAIGWRDVDQDEVQPLAAAVAFARWHRSAPTCERCGAQTRPDLIGARRVCVDCGYWAFHEPTPA